MSLANDFLALFFVTRERVGRQLIDPGDPRKKPVFGPWRDRRKTDSGPEWSYRQPTPDIIDLHLSGRLFYRSKRARLQTYLVSEDGMSVCMVVDLDVTETGAHSHQPQHFATSQEALAAARGLVQAARALGLVGWCEITKSGGIHIWFFFRSAIPAADANAIGRFLVARANLHPATEVFPNTVHPFGSPVLLPYAGIAPAGRQVMLNPETGEVLRAEDFAPAALEARIDPDGVRRLLDGEAGAVKPLTAPVLSPVASVSDDEAVRRWQAVLAACARLREIAHAAEAGQTLSYADWALRLLPHLKPLGEWGYAEFHRLSAFDPRYDAAECDDKFDSLDGAPTRCESMGCGRDPHRDCGLPTKNVSPAYFSVRAVALPVLNRGARAQEPTLRTTAAGWPVPDPGVFYGLAGEIVQVIAPHTEADPMAVLLSLLVGFGNVIGRSVFFTVEATPHHANLNAVIVGKSAIGRKGTSMDHARSFLQAIDPDWASVRIQSGLSSGEGLIHAVRDAQETLEPIKEKGRVIDYQKVIADSGEADKRLLVVETEFAKVLKVIQRDGNTLSPIIRNAWDTGNLRVMTKTAERATAAHISVIGHITQDELLRELDDTEVANGLANRFLWIASRRSKLLPEGGELHKLDMTHYHEALQSAAAFGRSAGELHRDGEARALWAEIYPTLTREEPGLFGSMIARAAPIVVRLSMIYAVLDKSPVIEPRHLTAALAVWQYAEDSTRFIFGSRLGDPMADMILDALRSRRDGMTQSEIRDLFGRNAKAEAYNARLEMLMSQGFIRCEREQTEGRSSIRWFAVQA